MKQDRPIPCFELYWLQVLTIILVVVIAAEASTCPASCVCSGNSSVICKDVTAHGWHDVCVRIDKEPPGNNSLISLHVLGDLSNSSLPILNIACLPSLRDLEISFVDLSGSLNGFNNLTVLNTLSLTHNGIQFLPKNVFSFLGSVQSLNLSYNNISDLNSKTFFGLYSLRVLDLSFNNIKSIVPTLFQSLTNLTYLNLGNNNIEHFTSWHLPPLSNLNVFLMNDNNLKSIYIGDNASDASSLNRIEYLDISNNPLECSCILQKVMNKISAQRGIFSNADKTTCKSPTPLINMSIVQLDETNLKCSNPHSLMSFPSEKKSVLYTSTIALECRAEAYPSPHIMWITPWGEKFSNAPSGLMVYKHLAEEDQINYFNEYEAKDMMMISSIRVTERNDLVISNFRGSLGGNFSCVAFNEVGSKTKVIHLTVHAVLKSVYVTSLKFASYCASGVLMIGFFIGFVRFLIQKLRHVVWFKVPLFTPAASVRPATMTEGAPSIYSDLSPPMSTLLPSISEKSLDGYATAQEFSGGESSPEKRPHPILDTIGDAKEKLRDGVGRKMESVRRNVQSIKESTGAAVHTIMESGSTAANKMKAGVVMGMETVKLHVQSVKELCGTGNMGEHTVSVISMETDIDTNEQKSLVRQVTFV